MRMRFGEIGCLSADPEVVAGIVTGQYRDHRVSIKLKLPAPIFRFTKVLPRRLASQVKDHTRSTEFDEVKSVKGLEHSLDAG